jgi:hypothetical protein
MIGKTDDIGWLVKAFEGLYEMCDKVDFDLRFFTPAVSWSRWETGQSRTFLLYCAV